MIATIIISLILAAVTGLILANQIKKRKRGQLGCGCGCENCPSQCHAERK